MYDLSSQRNFASVSMDDQERSKLTPKKKKTIKHTLPRNHSDFTP